MAKKYYQFNPRVSTHNHPFNRSCPDSLVKPQNMTPLSFILENGEPSGHLFDREVAKQLWQTATSIQVTAEHQCLLQTLRPHQPARKVFLTSVLWSTNTNRKVRWCSVLTSEVRGVLPALTVLLTCGTLGEINPSLWGSFHQKEK